MVSDSLKSLTFQVAVPVVFRFFSRIKMWMNSKTSIIEFFHIMREFWTTHFSAFYSTFVLIPVARSFSFFRHPETMCPVFAPWQYDPFFRCFSKYPSGVSFPWIFLFLVPFGLSLPSDLQGCIIPDYSGMHLQKTVRFICLYLNRC